ncbi:MAG TPA: 30S ribosomal protein S17 [Anaerolineales bacterium]|nr:30S ribosomal protein S17 [Anaerolineales bacterium]
MNTRRRLTGVVTSNKMQKTVVVEVSRTYQHRLYKKVVNSRRRVMVHDELDCQVGDHVRIVESHPLSRRKRWTVEEILRREVGAGVPEFEDTDAEILEAEA